MELKGFTTITKSQKTAKTKIALIEITLDRVKEIQVPQWVSDWPEWMPEEGIGFFGEES